MATDAEQCPRRLPGLTHVIRGNVCGTCGTPTVHAAAMRAIALPVDAPEIGPVSALACSCQDCRHPSTRPENVAARFLHRRRHEDFADWLGDRRDLAGFRAPSRFAIWSMCWQEEHVAPPETV